LEKEVVHPIAEEIRSRIRIKAGTFDSYLFEWDRKTQQEAFEKEAVKAIHATERMHASKKKALERSPTRRRERENEPESERRPPLKEEL
jgi:hypothetical protein